LHRSVSGMRKDEDQCGDATLGVVCTYDGRERDGDGGADIELHAPILIVVEAQSASRGGEVAVDGDRRQARRAREGVHSQRPIVIGRGCRIASVTTDCLHAGEGCSYLEDPD
jgi:hypothetical protein